MSGEIFDTDGNLVEILEGRPAGPFAGLNVDQLQDAMSTISSTGSQLSDHARRVVSLFDGSKNVTIGSAEAPIGWVLGVGFLAVLAYHHHQKGGR